MAKAKRAYLPTHRLDLGKNHEHVRPVSRLVAVWLKTPVTIGPWYKSNVWKLLKHIQRVHVVCEKKMLPSKQLRGLR